MTDRYPIPEFLRQPRPFVRVPIERPILFSSPMVRALLSGTKTQTRRVVKNLHPDCCESFVRKDDGLFGWRDEFKRFMQAFPCPYGQPGDRLWVREGFSGPHHRESLPPSLWHELDEIHYWADGNPSAGDWTRPRPSIHMPRWASRILLEITAVSVERLQDIGGADALAEGIQPADPVDFGTDHQLVTPACRRAYARLWESINGPGSWGANPWVWVVEFRRVKA